MDSKNRTTVNDIEYPMSRIGGQPTERTVIAEGTRITGTIASHSDIVLEGEVYGTIQTSGAVRISEKGKMSGEIVCAEIFLEGSLDGGPFRGYQILLESKSHLSGDIQTKRLLIRSGARITGGCQLISGKTEQKKITNPN